MDTYGQGPQQCARYQKSIVPVGGHKEDGDWFMGTGLWLDASKPVILAPDHGGVNHDEWMVTTDPRVPCRVVSNAPEHSILLEPVSEVEIGSPITPGECQMGVSLGAPVFTLGFSGWTGVGVGQIRHGVVSTADENLSLYCVDAFTVQCNSGGPVWLAKSGRLIGTVQRGYTTSVRRDQKDDLEVQQSLTGFAPCEDFIPEMKNI